MFTLVKLFNLKDMPVDVQNEFMNERICCDRPKRRIAVIIRMPEEKLLNRLLSGAIDSALFLARYKSSARLCRWLIEQGAIAGEMICIEYNGEE